MMNPNMATMIATLAVKESSVLPSLETKVVCLGEGTASDEGLVLSEFSLETLNSTVVEGVGVRHGFVDGEREPDDPTMVWVGVGWR